MKWFIVGFWFAAGWYCGKGVLNGIGNASLKLYKKYYPDKYKDMMTRINKTEKQPRKMEEPKTETKNPIGFKVGGVS